MDYHCPRVFRSRDRKTGKHSPGFSVFRTRVYGRSDAEPCRVPIQSTFVEIVLLTINLSHARQVTYEVWGFHVTDGDVCSDWGECNGCFCRDGNGNNWPSIDDFYSAKTCKCRSSDISAQNAENHVCRKGTWSATGSNTTNWMMDLVFLVHSDNLPGIDYTNCQEERSPRRCSGSEHGTAQHETAMHSSSEHRKTGRVFSNPSNATSKYS